MENNSNKLILEPNESNGSYNATFNGKVVAEVLPDVDGYYHIQIEGYWEADNLIELGKLVVELNRPYEEELKAYFDKQQSDFKNQEIDIDW